MSLAINISTDDGHVEVWLDGEDALPEDGLVIGVGATQEAALQAAEAELLTALEQVRQQQADLGVIQPRPESVIAELVAALKGIATAQWPELTIAEQVERLDRAYAVIAKAEPHS